MYTAERSSDNVISQDIELACDLAIDLESAVAVPWTHKHFDVQFTCEV